MKKVCVLSTREVGRLEHFKELPRCEEHRHIPVWQALEGIKKDLLVTIGEEFGLNAVREQDSNNRAWRGRSSGGYQVMQFVKF